MQYGHPFHRPGVERRLRSEPANSGHRGLALLALLAVVAAAAAGLASCASGPPGPPSVSQGTIEHRALPPSIQTLTLTDQNGRPTSFAALRGRTVMLVPFLTLCSDICPLTTGNLLEVQRSLDQSHAASKVQIVELSVDPTRDTQGRLASYAKLTGASWEMVTESDAALADISTFFGFLHQQVPQGNPPAVDWLTNQPLTYDVNHTDGYVLIDGSGFATFATGAGPGFHGTLNPTLYRFLSDQGIQNLNHPPQPAWTPTSALLSLGWMIGRSIPNAGS